MINTNQRKKIVFILLIFSLFMVISSANAAEITINSTDNFKSDIQKAVSGDIIKLDSSSVGGQFNLNSDNVDITITESITIQSANPSQNAIINLNQKGRAFHVEYGGDLTLINITIINGNSSDGGAIYNEGELTLKGCTFTNNKVTGTYASGGAINNFYGNLIAINCYFTDNTADDSGGAIENMGNFDYGNGNLDLIDCTFINNHADKDGGAIDNGRNTYLTNCTFTENTASRGGSFFNWGDAILATCTFKDNVATYGGAIYNQEEAFLTNCLFITNKANLGSAIYVEDGEFNVSYSQFLNNVGDYQIYKRDDALVVADYNWWGSNNPQGDYNAAGIVSNYFVMKITTSVVDLTRTVGDNLAISYAFVLNGTNNNANALDKFAPFTVNIMVNGKLWQTIDGRKSAQYNIPLSTVDTKISAQLHSAISTVNYKANTNIENKFPMGTGDKIATSLVISNFKPLFNKNNIVKVTARDKNGKILANKDVVLYINGKPVYTAKTNAAGVATFKYIFKTRNAHKIVVKFAGDTKLLASNSKTLSLTPKDKTTTSLAKFKAKYKKTATLKATLKNHKNKAIANKYLKFYANNKYLGQAKTNAKGVATLTKTIPVKGSVKFVAKYAGDKTYHDSDYTKIIRV